jgi:hypothetical protein
MNPNVNDSAGGGEALRRIPTQPPPDTSAEIGSLLRAARIQKGHSIEAVVQQTRIPRKYILSL